MNLEYFCVARDLALEAGHILRSGFGKDHQIDYKGAIDLVTEIDRRSEQLIVSSLSRHYPSHYIVSEEEAVKPGTSAYHWYIDPLDGTTNYSHNFPTFCVSIALYHEDKPVLGIVYDPMHEELYEAVQGGAAYLNGKELRISKVAELGKALLGTGFPYDISESADNNLAPFAAMIKRCQGVRRVGAAALDLCYVAAGRLDGFWELKLKPWDTAAGRLIVEAAGGRVTDFLNRPFYPTTPHILATNGLLHHAMLEVLACNCSLATKPSRTS